MEITSKFYLSLLKAMCNTITTFKVSNRKSSEVAIDSGDAVELQQREFISKTNDIQYGRTVNLTSKTLNKWLDPYKDENNEKYDFSNMNNIEDILNAGKGKKGKKKTKSERRETKKQSIQHDDKATDKDIIQQIDSHNKNKDIKTKLVVKKPQEKEVSNLDQITKKPSEFFQENWVDPYKDMTILKDETPKINNELNTIKDNPQKNNDIFKEGKDE